MNNYFSKLGDRAKNVRLSETEKAKSKNFLSEYMTMRTARVETRAQKRNVGIFNLFSSKKFVGVMAILLLASTVGSVTYASEDTVPGDTLYPVKIHWNEGIRGAFAFGHVAKAHWNAELAARRLEEAEKLEWTNEATPEQIALLEERFEHYAEKMQAHVEKVEEKAGAEAAAKISSRVESILAAHEGLLALIEERGALPPRNFLGMAKRLKHAKGNIEGFRERVEGELEEGSEDTREKLAEAHRRVVEKRVTILERKVEWAEDGDRDELAEGYQKSIDDIREAIEAGEFQQEDCEYMRAFRSYHNALKSARGVEVRRNAGLWRHKNRSDVINPDGDEDVAEEEDEEAEEEDEQPAD